MASEVFNISKGRFAEFWNRVNDNDPTNSAIVGVMLKVSESQATLRDYDDLGALLGAAGNTECDFTNYARETWTDTDLAGPTVDDTNDRNEVDLSDWTISSAGGASNNTITQILTCYDSDTTGGTDSNIVPVTMHDTTSPTTNGSDLTVQWNASGVGRAS